MSNIDEMRVGFETAFVDGNVLLVIMKRSVAISQCLLVMSG